MSFNPDSTKQAQEMNFRRKTTKKIHAKTTLWKLIRQVKNFLRIIIFQLEKLISKASGYALRFKIIYIKAVLAKVNSAMTYLPHFYPIYPIFTHTYNSFVSWVDLRAFSAQSPV